MTRTGTGTGTDQGVATETSTGTEIPESAPSTTLDISSPSNAAQTTTTPASPILLGSQTISIDSNSAVIIGSQTIAPGSAVTLSDGQRISVASGGAIIVNGYIPDPTPTPSIVVIDGATITADSSGGFVISSQTLYPGNAITVGGEIITLPSPAPTTFATGIIPSQAPVTNVVIAGETLTPGGQITVGIDVLSLEPSGTAITVVGTVTIGGGIMTATATAAPKKKNAGEMQRGSVIFIALQISFVALAGWLH